MHNSCVMRHILIVASAALAIGVMLGAQTNQRQSAGGDWPMYSLNHAGTRFSPLTDINAANVARLAPAWSVRAHASLGRRGSRRRRSGGGRPDTLRRRPV